MASITDLSTVFGSSTRVSDTDNDALSVGPSVTGATQNAASAAADTSLFSLDQTAVSSTGGAMLQAMGTSDVRADKVSSLQAAIANGSYNVSSADVASKLISSMLDEG